jgi:DNA-binding NtrC family response regulator
MPAVPNTSSCPIEIVILCTDEEVRDVITYWLASLPVGTKIAADGREANPILHNSACELLITDRILPPWPGLDTFRQLRSANPGLRIAFVDNGDVDTWILARAIGATVRLLRPLTRRSVIEALGRPELVS